MAKNLLLTLRKHRTVIATIAIVLLAAITFGVIWFIRQAQEPLAPTAPVSVPKAGENVCSVLFELPNECLDFSPVEESTASDSARVTFKCSGLNGSNNFIIKYRTSLVVSINPLTLRLLTRHVIPVPSVMAVMSVKP